MINELSDEQLQISRISMEKPNITHEELVREISKQTFENEEEANKFISDLMSGKVSPSPQNNEELAQDLVNQAYDVPLTKARKLLKQALKLDPECADVYIYKAHKENDPEKAIKHFKQAIELSLNSLGEKTFTEDKGNFWMIHQTRPFMEAKQGLASCLTYTGKKDEAISIYEEMLELNPNDNQGVRYLLGTLLLEQKQYKSFEELVKSYDDESSTEWYYNLALYEFIKNRKTKKLNELLLTAYNSNNLVIDYMLGLKEIPDKLPEYVSQGGENEAVSYMSRHWRLWKDSDGGLDCLFNFQNLRKRIN